MPATYGQVIVSGMTTFILFYYLKFFNLIFVVFFFILNTHSGLNHVFWFKVVGVDFVLLGFFDKSVYIATYIFKEFSLSLLYFVDWSIWGKSTKFLEI